MSPVTFCKGVEAEDRENIHIYVVNHETYITEAARSFDRLFLQFPPQDQVDEYLGDLLEGLQVDIFGSQAGDNDGVQTLLVDDLLERFFAL